MLPHCSVATVLNCMADVFCCSLTLRIILGYENCSGMFLSKWVFQFSLFDKRTRIQAYGALRVLHHPASGWNCVSATTNTNRNPETNPHNIHPPSLTSHLTYPRPPACLLASGCCQQCGRYNKTRGVPRPTVIAHLCASSYTRWSKKRAD